MRTLLLSMIICLSAATSAYAQTTCPAESEDARQILRQVVSSPNYADTRQWYGLPELAVSRLLTDAQDGTVCGRIYQFLGTMTSEADWRTRWNATFYKVNNLFYVVLAPKPNTEPVPPGKVFIDLRWSALYVLDSGFNLIAGIAM